MLGNARINARQFTVLVTVFTIGSAILVVPSALAEQAKEDAWIAGIVAAGVSMLFIWIYSMLANRFPNMTLTQYSEILLGKWTGKTVSLLFCTFIFLLSETLLREISDFITTQIMPDTPIQSIHILYLSIVIMAARLGLETISRAAEIFFPWILGLFSLLVLFLIPQVDMHKIMPILGDGFKPVFRGAFPLFGLPFLELVVFLMILPSVNRVKGTGKAFMAGTLLGAAVLSVISLLSISVLGADFTARSMYPSYSLAKKINIGDFLERLEVIMAGIWFLTIYFKLTICFYATALGLAQTFELKVYKPLLLPLGMIMIVFSIYTYPNIAYFRSFIATAWTPYCFIYGLFLPLLLLGVAMWRRKKTI